MAAHSSILVCPHGQRSLAGSSPWGLTESDMTEVMEDTHTHTHMLIPDIHRVIHRLSPTLATQ